MARIPYRAFPFLLSGAVIVGLGLYSYQSTQASAQAHAALRGAVATEVAQNDTLAHLREQLAAVPTATPQPRLPLLQVCPQEAASTYTGRCANGQPGELYLDGFADDVLVMDNGHAFGNTTLLYRVYKSAGLDEHLYGTAQSSDLDPQWSTTVWPVQALWGKLELSTGLGSAAQPPDPGSYRIEVLDHDGHFLAQTTVYFTWSPNDVVTPTPAASSDGGS